MPLDITDLSGDDLFLALSSGKDISIRGDTLSPYHPTSPWIDTSIVFIRHEHTCTSCGNLESMMNPAVFILRISAKLGTHFAPIGPSITNPEKRFASLPVKVKVCSSTSPFCTQCYGREGAVLATEGEVVPSAPESKRNKPEFVHAGLILGSPPLGSKALQPLNKKFGDDLQEFKDDLNLPPSTPWEAS